MPYRVFLSAEEPFAYAMLGGVIRWADIGDAVRKLYLDPRWAVGGDALWDVRGVESIDVDPRDLPVVKAAFEAVAAAREGGRTAFLMGAYGDEALWALSQTLGPPSRRRVAFFTELLEALAFLGRLAEPENLEFVAEG